MIDWLRREALEPTIKLIGRDVPIDLVRNRRAKRLTLRLALDGSAVRITLPHWCRSADAIAFAHARQEWLSAQLAKVPNGAIPPAMAQCSIAAKTSRSNGVRICPANRISKMARSGLEARGKHSAHACSAGSNVRHWIYSARMRRNIAHAATLIAPM